MDPSLPGISEAYLTSVTTSPSVQRKPAAGDDSECSVSGSESPDASLTVSTMGLDFLQTPSPDFDLHLERQPSQFASTLAQSEEIKPVNLTWFPKPTLDVVNRVVFPGGFSKKGENVANPDAMKTLLLPNEASNMIYVCDSDGPLTMFYFRDEFISGPADVHFPNREQILAIRGWIVNSQTSTMLCNSFSEGSVAFLDSTQVRSLKWDSYEFTPFIEGNVVRAFWDGTAWKYAAHRKIDSRKSRIPGVEVELFRMLQNAWPEFSEALLKPECIYVFVIVHRDNQVMNPDPVEKECVYHVATIRSTFAPDAENKIPFLLEDCGGYAPEHRFDGARYLHRLILEEVCQEYLDRGRCVVARHGYNLVQIAPPRMAKLMAVRGLDQAPYVPPELMWLRLNAEDRPLLVDAVPFHQKAFVTAERMDVYVLENIKKTADFCAEALTAKLGGAKYLLSKALNFILKQVILNGDSHSQADIARLYEAQLWYMLENNGSTLYRCFRDVEIAKIKMEKLGVIQLVSEEPSHDNHRQSKSKADGRQGKNGNKKGRRDDGKGNGSSAGRGKNSGEKRIVGRKPQITGNVAFREEKPRQGAKSRRSPAVKAVDEEKAPSPGAGKPSAVEKQSARAPKVVEVRTEKKEAASSKGTTVMDILKELK